MAKSENLNSKSVPAPSTRRKGLPVWGSGECKDGGGVGSGAGCLRQARVSDRGHRAMCSIQPVAPSCPPPPQINACSGLRIPGVSRMCLGWVSVQPMSLHQPQCIQVIQSSGQAVEWGRCNVGQEAGPPGSAWCHEGGAKQSCRVNRKRRT